jgi:tetratricopeptide (TPR) repeat protein
MEGGKMTRRVWGGFFGAMAVLGLVLAGYGASPVFAGEESSAFYLNRGVDLFKKGQWDQAIAEFNKALELNPRNAEAYSCRGSAYLKRGRVDLAMADINKALEVNPREAMAYKGRAELHLMKSEFDQAWEDVNQAQRLGLRVDPEFIWELKILSPLHLNSLSPEHKAAPATSSPAEALECPRLVAKGSFSMPVKGGLPIFIDAGQGLTFKIEPTGEEEMRLLVLDKGTQVTEIKTKGWGLFTGFSRQEAGPVTYWILEDYTGGFHCCVNQYFFCRPDFQQTVRFLGTIHLGHVDYGNAGRYEEQFPCHEGKIFLKSCDNRFAYFHTSYAQSWPMFFPQFHQLTPEGIRLINDRFKEVYLDEAKDLNEMIKDELAKRQSTPEAIVNVYGSFTDDLGVLLVARTINYLCACERSAAWKSLEDGVRSYYHTTNGLDGLKIDIDKAMRWKPY